MPSLMAGQCLRTGRPSLQAAPSAGHRCAGRPLLRVSAAGNSTQTVTVQPGSASLPSKKKEQTLVGMSPIAGDPEDMKSLANSLSVAEAAARQQRGDGKSIAQPPRQAFKASGEAGNTVYTFKLWIGPGAAEADVRAPSTQRAPPRGLSSRRSRRPGRACRVSRSELSRV